MGTGEADDLARGVGDDGEYFRLPDLPRRDRLPESSGDLRSWLEERDLLEETEGDLRRGGGEGVGPRRRGGERGSLGRK